MGLPAKLNLTKKAPPAAPASGSSMVDKAKALAKGIWKYTDPLHGTYHITQNMKNFIQDEKDKMDDAISKEDKKKIKLTPIESDLITNIIYSKDFQTKLAKMIDPASIKVREFIKKNPDIKKAKAQKLDMVEIAHILVENMKLFQLAADFCSAQPSEAYTMVLNELRRKIS